MRAYKSKPITELTGGEAGKLIVGVVVKLYFMRALWVVFDRSAAKAIEPHAKKFGEKLAEKTATTIDEKVYGPKPVRTGYGYKPREN